MKALSQHRAEREAAVTAKAEFISARDRARLAQAEAESRSKSQFLANMSHEIRTPMNAILGYAQLLQRESGLKPRQREYLETIDRSGVHLLSLINDVLDMAKIEAGQITLNPEEIDFDELLLDIERMFRLRAKEKCLQLVLSRMPELPSRLLLDQSKVRQVLVNLLSNALKFTDSGHVEVRVSCAGNTDDTVHLVIDVEDTGRGINAKVLDAIFQPFIQTESGAKQRGTGLGLTVSRKFARKLGGDLTVTSTVGRGSVFRFTFDAQSGGKAGPTVKRVVSIDTLSPAPCTLVVDDEADNREVLTRMLESVGFRVRATTGGEEAIKAVIAEPPDIILMDLMMPRVDGTEATARIRALDVGRDIPILIVSASAFDGQQSECIEAGANAFVRKPIREHELFEAIADHLPVTYLDAQTSTLQSAVDNVDHTTMCRLPDGLNDVLLKAVQSGDINVIDTILTEAESVDYTMARRLRELADDFRYDELIELLSGNA